MLGLRCQTDRQLWLGRNHTPGQPLALLSRVPEVPASLDTGLDPVAALGVMLRIAPGAQACVTFATAASQDPATLLAIIDKYRQPTYLERASAMSATLASIQWASHRPHRDYLPALQALTTALVFTLPKVHSTHLGALTEAQAAAGGERRLLHFLDLGAGNRLMVGDDRQSLNRRPRQLTLFLHFLMHQKPEIGSGAQRPSLPDPHKGYAAPLIAPPKVSNRLRRIAAMRHALCQLCQFHRLG